METIPVIVRGTFRLKFLLVPRLRIDLIGTSNRPYYWIQFIQIIIQIFQRD